MDISLVIFDIAGTTVKDNDNVGKAFQTALLKFGFEVSLDSINPLMGYEKHEAIHAILQQTGVEEAVLTADLIEQIHREFVRLMIDYYTTTQDLSPLNNVESTFAALKDMGISTALNTGFSRDIAAVIVSRLGWIERSLIDFFIASDEVENGRPYPDMVQKLIERAGVDSTAKVMKVGDTEVDVNEGLNAGCKYVVAVTTGAYTRDELEKYKPTHIIDDIADILPIIQNHHG